MKQIQAEKYLIVFETETFYSSKSNQEKTYKLIVSQEFSELKEKIYFLEVSMDKR